MHLKKLKFPTIGALLVAAFLAANALVNYRNIATLNEEANWVVHTHEVLGKAGEVLLTVVDAETRQRAFLLTGKVSFLQPYQDSLAQLEQQISELKALAADNPAQQHRVAQLRTAPLRLKIKLENCAVW